MGPASPQVLLVLLFTASQTVYLFRKLELVDVTPSTVVGFRSLDEVIAMMIVFNITVFIIFVVMLVYQTITSRTLGNFRLVSNRQAPELTLANKMRYHLFLSHVRCSIGTSLGHPPAPPHLHPCKALSSTSPRLRRSGAAPKIKSPSSSGVSACFCRESWSSSTWTCAAPSL